MNVRLLILPLFLATLALSAAKTLPTDLSHDVQGKAPLSATRMSLARSAGSSCQDGCSTSNNVACHPIVYEGSVVAYEKQVWNPHSECRFAWSGDCIKLRDVLCNAVSDYPPSDPTCSGTPFTVVNTTSSSCAKPVPVTPGGPS